MCGKSRYPKYPRVYHWTICSQVAKVNGNHGCDGSAHSVKNVQDLLASVLAMTN